MKTRKLTSYLELEGQPPLQDNIHWIINYSATNSSIDMNNILESVKLVSSRNDGS